MSAHTKERWHHRFTQPSTAAGIGLVAHGIAAIAGAGPEAATEIAGAATEAVKDAATGDYIVGALSLVGGLLSVFMTDRSNHH